MRNLPPGSRLGRFEIVGVLGEGAMGVVYLANDPEIERPVAIKTLRSSPPPGQPASEIETRFLKEAKLAGRLQHPNIVTIYEAGRSGDTFFIAMEYIEGDPLTRFAADRSGPSLAVRIDLIRQVAHALQHAHERGVLHRDVKPGNILVTGDRRVKVADFGIGKLLTGGTGDLTRTGQMLGSPAYMSPEQIRGEKLDGRSDLFSLAVVAYELLTGSRPFPGESITTLVYQILHTEPRDPRELRADLPPATRGVFLRLLAKAPNLRPSDAGEFLREIRKIEGELQDVEPTRTMALPPPPPPPAAPAPSHSEPLPPELARRTTAGEGAGPAPPSPRRAGPGYLFGAAALLVALALLLWIWRSTEQREQRAAQTALLATPAPMSPAAAPSPPEPVATVAEPGVTELPTAGPASAADASVGATRLARPTRPPRLVPTQPAAPEQPREAPTPVPPPPAAVEPPAASPAITDNVYRTRRYAKFQSSPDQARLFVDGRYVGIVDDWDDRGGGRAFEFPRQGSHRVRMELPGYRTLNLVVLVTPSAEDDTVDIEDELERESRVAYPKLSSPAGRTVGPVEFAVDPPEAVVSEGGRSLGPASSFGPGSPLRLPGPGVHDLVISAPGRQSRTVRILVAPNAERERARVEVELKRTD